MCRGRRLQLWCIVVKVACKSHQQSGRCFYFLFRLMRSTRSSRSNVHTLRTFVQSPSELWSNYRQYSEGRKTLVLRSIHKICTKICENIQWDQSYNPAQLPTLLRRLQVRSRRWDLLLPPLRRLKPAYWSQRWTRYKIV